MKNLVLILGLLIGANSFGQFGKSVQLMGSATIQGNETVLIKSKQMSQTNGFIGIQIVINDTTAINSGTGYAIPLASLIDGTEKHEFATLTTVENSVYTTPNDTMTITKPDSYLFGLSGLPFDYVGAYIQGAVGDTFDVSVHYVGKKY